MHYCPTCSKPIWGSWPLDSATLPYFGPAYCQCSVNGTMLTIRIMPTISNGTTMLPNVGYGQVLPIAHAFAPCHECGYVVDTPFHTQEQCEQLQRVPPLQGQPPEKMEVPQVFLDAFTDEEVSL